MVASFSLNFFVNIINFGAIMRIKDFKQLLKNKLIDSSKNVSSDNIEILQKPDLRGLGGHGKVYARMCAKEESGSVKSVIVSDGKIVFSIEKNLSNTIKLDNILKWAEQTHDYDDSLLCYRNTHGRNIVVDDVVFNNRNGVFSIIFETKI